MRKLGILLGLVVGILVFQGVSFAQIDRIPGIRVIYKNTTFSYSGITFEHNNLEYYILGKGYSSYYSFGIKVVAYSPENQIVINIYDYNITTFGCLSSSYKSTFSLVNVTDDYAEFILSLAMDTSTEVFDVKFYYNGTFNYTKFFGNYISGEWHTKQLSNIYEYNSARYKFLPTLYSSDSIKVYRDNIWITLSVPSVFTQIFEAWGFFDAQAQKYFVFAIANHQSYPGYRYLYVLRYDSNGNYETTKVMLNTFEVAYMIPYVRDLGNYRLILYDYTNNRYLDYEWETYENGDIAFVSMETYYSYFIPKTPHRYAYTTGSTAHFNSYANVNGTGQLFFTLGCSGSGWCRLDLVRAYCLNGTEVEKTVGCAINAGESKRFFFDFGCAFYQIYYSGYMSASGSLVNATTYMGFDPQENLGRTKKNIFLFEPDVYNYGNTIFASYQPKTLTLDVEPEVGDSETPFNITVTQQNLVTPYDLSIYVKTPQDTDYWLWFTVEDYTGDTYQTTFMGGQVLGDYCFYAIAVDSEGSTVQSNIDCMTINETISPLLTFNISVYPTVGTRDTIFQFNTTNISGGVPPYYVYVTTNESVDKILVCTLDAPGKCIGTFKHKYSVFGVGWANVIGLVYDSRGFWTRSLNSVPVYFNVPEPGPPLNVTLTISPETGNDETIFLLCLNISGGLPPYTVNWYDKTIPMCTNEQYNFSAPFEICERVMFYPGDHSVYAIVTSSDEQSATSNTVSVSVEYSSGRNYNVWMDCIGELGEGVYGGVTYPGPPAPPKYNLTQPLAGINVTLLEQSGYGWVTPFLTPAFIAVAAILGVGAAVEYYIRSGGVGFALTVMSLSLILWYLGFFPASVAVLITVLCGLFLWYLFSKMGGG